MAFGCLGEIWGSYGGKLGIKNWPIFATNVVVWVTLRKHVQKENCLKAWDQEEKGMVNG